MTSPRGGDGRGGEGRPAGDDVAERAEGVAQVEAGDDRLLLPVLAAPVVEAARLAEELQPRTAALRRVAHRVDRRPLPIREMVAAQAVGDAIGGRGRHAPSLAGP